MISAAIKYARLLDSLQQKATSGQVDWSYDQISSEVSAKIGDFTISMKRTRRGETPIVLVTLYNALGEVLDTFDDDDLSGQVPSTGQETYWQLMNDLMKTGRRVATGAEKALDELLKTLSSDDETS